VSQNDSFIDEVSEELRRDRLYGLFRRYGWIGIALILLVVAGTAWTQWQNARTRAVAEGFGDALLAAMALPTPAERQTALAAIPVTGTQGAVVALMASSDPLSDPAAALAALDRAAGDAALPPVWRDLAILRRVTLQGSDVPLADRRAALEPLAEAGRPYRALAAEHLAYLLIEEGRDADAIAALRTLTEAQDATAAQRARVAEVITILGGAPDGAASDG
jgi:hypothetical protein